MADLFDKEELSTVGSLFGTSPEMLAIAKERQAYQQGTQAGQNLLGGILGQAGVFAERGGAGLRGALGVQNPDEQMASLRQQAAQQFDTNTPEGLVQMAQFLNSKGDAAGARQAIMLAQGQAQKVANLRKTQAEEVAKLREPLPNIAKLQAYRDKMVASGASAKAIAEIDAVIKAEGEGKGTKIDLSGLSQLFAKSEANASGKAASDAIEQASQSLKSNSVTSRNITEIEKLLPDTFQGQYANWSKTASKSLAGLGVPVGEKASNTETVQALMNSLVMPMIKQLPGSLAAKELAFLQQQKPDTLQEPATVKRLLGMIKEDIAANRVLVKRADAYQKQDKYGSLQGFNMGLQQDQIYQDLARYNKLKTAKTITQEDADFAKAFEKEAGL